jgi:hypothetical protein
MARPTTTARGGAARKPTTKAAAPATPTATPAVPSGILFFIHGANATSEGLVETVARIEDQVRDRGWDVTVVAPEWRAFSE